MPDVTCLGILVADAVALPVDRYPSDGELMRVDRIELHAGGCANNTGISLVKIGIDTAVIGKVGADGFGDFMVNTLEASGINCDGVKRDASAATSASMVLVQSGGERSFIHYVGANANLTENDVDMELVSRSKILHVAGSFLMPGIDGEPTARILKKAREMGVMTSLDTAGDPKKDWIDVLKPCFRYLDFAVPSFEEASVITGKDTPQEIAKAMMDMGVKTVALKMGSKGCYLRNVNEEYTIPIYKVNAIDANGAGDSFAAGFLTGIINGWSLEQCGRFANAVGAFCVQAVGATTGIKDQATILKFIEEYK